MSAQHRCVFVGNIPYDATEEQLVQICEEVGPVVSFRLVTDRETGKPKGYGFCEFRDEETALSARRNLSGYELNGRQLRVDFAENEKGGAERREQANRAMPGAPSNPPVPAGDTVGYPAAVAAAGAMAGALGQNGGNLGNDQITNQIASMSKQQIYDTLVSMKTLIQQDQQQARQLLIMHPELTKFLFHAQILLGMVRLPQQPRPPLPPTSAPPPNQPFIQPPAYSQPPAVIPQPPPLPQQPRPPPLPPMPPQPPQSVNFQAAPPFGQPQPPFSVGMPFQPQTQPPLPLQPPPQHSFQQPQQQHPNMNMGQPRGPVGLVGDRSFPQPPFGVDTGGPPVYGQVQMQGPPQQQQLTLDVEQQHLLQQVMNLTPEQINSLPPEQRQQVVQLQQVIQLQQAGLR